MSDQQNETQESPEEKKNKIEKAFNETVAKLEALTGKVLPKNENKRLPQDRVGSVIAELFKEENEELEKEIKQEVKDVLKAYVVTWREIRVKEQEFEKVKQETMKKFTETGKKILSKIDGLPAIEALYKQALSAISKPTEKNNPITGEN